MPAPRLRIPALTAAFERRTNVKQVWLQVPFVHRYEGASYMAARRAAWCSLAVLTFSSRHIEFLFPKTRCHSFFNHHDGAATRV
jgi:hypothetical protein